MPNKNRKMGRPLLLGAAAAALSAAALVTPPLLAQSKHNRSAVLSAAPARMTHANYVPEEPQMHSRDHRLSLSLIAYTGEDGRNHFKSAAGTEPPLIRVWPGDTLDITYKNELSGHSREKCATGPCMNMTNLHFHGLSVSPQYGQDDAIDMIANPGQSLHYSLHIPHDQLPGLFWYHTHPHGESMRQDLDGMSGAIVVEGIDQYVPEVRGLREQILVLRARAVDGHNKPEISSLEQLLNIPAAGCGSDAGELERVFTVNDTLRPSIEIAPHERQFWRIVNAAPDRYVDLRLGHQPLEIVAMDGMPLAYTAPDKPTMKMDHVLLPPGARVEAIVEGPGQDAHASLRSLCVNTGPDGDWNPGMVLADIVQHSPPDPGAYKATSDYIAPAPKTINVTRYERANPDFIATFTEDKNGFYINGEKYRPTSGPMTIARVGTYQHWRIVNDTREIHPMHIHQVHFLAYAINSRLLDNPLWLDTVNVPIGGSVDVVMDFTNPVIRGMSVFHCHLLNHEDKGMMAKILFE